MAWCPYCSEFDVYGYGLCESCGYDFPADEPTAPPQPVERVLQAEVFGVGRTDEGKPTNYFRDVASNERLAALRSMPYHDYLETPEWQNVRLCALDAACWRCQLCNTDDMLAVHHRTYARLGAEVLEDLTVVCRDCHQRFHDASFVVGGGDPPPPRRVRFIVSAAGATG